MPIDKMKCNCFDNMILFIGDYYKADTDLYFLDSFGFNYTKESINLNSQCIQNKNKNNETLRDYCGIIIEPFDNDSYADLEKADAILYLKSLVGIKLVSPDGDYYAILSEKNNDNYLYHNLFKTYESQYISKQKIFDEVAEFYVFNKYEQNESVTLQKIIQFIKKNTNSYNHMIHLIDFVNDFENVDFNNLNNFGGDITKSKLIFGITNIGWSRHNFACALEYVKKNFHTTIFEELIIDMYNDYKLWELVKNYIIKIFFVKEKKLTIEKVFSTFQDIVNVEKKIIKYIDKVL